MALRKAQRLLFLYPRSQPGGWERVPRGSASCQVMEAAASENGFPTSRLEVGARTVS